MELPKHVRFHMRGVSIISNDRPHSWRWWSASGGQNYQALCNDLLLRRGERNKEAQQTILYFLPRASTWNAKLRKQYGRQLLGTMESQRALGHNIFFQIYQPCELHSHEFENYLRTTSLHTGHNAMDLRDYVPPFFLPVAINKNDTSTIHNNNTQEDTDNTREGGLIDLVISDSAYCQLKVHRLPPAHTATQVSNWVRLFDRWTLNACTELRLVHDWIAA